MLIQRRKKTVKSTPKTNEIEVPKETSEKIENDVLDSESIGSE